MLTPAVNRATLRLKKNADTRTGMSWIISRFEGPIILFKKEIDAYYSCNQDEADCIFRCKKKWELLFERYVYTVSFWLVQVDINAMGLPNHPVYRRKNYI